MSCVYLLLGAASVSLRDVAVHHGVDGLHHIHHLVLVNGSTVVLIIPGQSKKGFVLKYISVSYILKAQDNFISGVVAATKSFAIINSYS